MAATAPTHTAPKSEMQLDMDDWINRVSHTAKNHEGITNPTGSAAWSTSLFGCFDPIDTCAITCCCPCVTFGKTHHRLRKDANLAGYSPVNASVCPRASSLDEQWLGVEAMVANAVFAIVFGMVGGFLRGLALYPQPAPTIRCPRTQPPALDRQLCDGFLQGEWDGLGEGFGSMTLR